jgi:hypothetical protein
MPAAADCRVCAEFTTMPYQCSYCGGTFCSDHRLPEDHNCPATSEDSRQWFSSSSNQDGRRAVSTGDVDPPAPMDSSDVRTYGSADGTVGEASPDVALDGSVQQDGENTDTQDTNPGLATRIVRRLQNLF